MKHPVRYTRYPKPRLLACALASCLLVAAPTVFAQGTAATVRGQVTGASGPAASAEIIATNTATGLIRRVQSSENGTYALAGLPPGTYRIDVSSGGASTSQTVVLQVSQVATLDFPLEGEAAADPAQMETVMVTAQAYVETKTSEIASYVSQKQIDSLPQVSRNFLAFADTIPGVIFETDQNGITKLRGGAQNSNGVNVYIDGVGQKNYVLKGGISGQDGTRGNPFPQSAIAEYKVITQNYKAEFDQLSSVAITALTKSGTNEFHGDVFFDYTDQDWRATRPNEFASSRGKVDSQEKQYGASLGGPIIKDTLFFFGSYEKKEFVTPGDVTPGENFPVGLLPAELQPLVGSISVPFEEDLYFGKLTWTPDESNLFELTAKYRTEDQIEGTGGANAFSFGSTKQQDETRAALRWQYTTGEWLNDAQFTFEESTYEPRPITTDGFGVRLLDYTADSNGRTILNYGAGENFQRKGQKGWGFQDDLTWTGLEWNGNHTVKMGFKYKDIEINAFEQQPFSPQYFFNIFESLEIPTRVEFGQLVPGAVSPNVITDNQQFGLYIQDDWEVNDKLTLNLGLRWDYEKTPSYLDFQPRPELVAALRSWTNIQNTDYDIEDFIGNGSNREAFKDAWQPRLGASYDLFADQRHVIFGGIGRSYDRNLFDYLALERSKGTFPRYRFNFNSEANPCDLTQSNCIEWDPAFFNPEALAGLVAANPNLGGEINLINNDLKTPYSDQFSIGMRNTVTVMDKDWNTSVTLSRVESKDGIYFALGNRYSDGRFRENPDATWGGSPFGQPIPGFGTLLIADNGIETRNNSVLIQIDKPYTQSEGWGVTFAYTYNDPEENRLNAANSDERYIFDYPNPDGQGFLRSLNIPRHRVVFTGIVDGPWDMTYSVKATYASPVAKDSLNCNAIGFNDCFFDPFVPEGTFGSKQVDIAATKYWDLGEGLVLRFRADVINLFNTYNYTDYDTWRGGPTDPNANFGNRNGNGISTPTRTFKMSVGASF